MCWVTPPASPAATLLRLIKSSSDVLPWSTCPMIVTTGARETSSPWVRPVCMISSSSAFSLSILALWPISSATMAAVSWSIIWLIVTMLPRFIITLMTSVLFTDMRWASSETVILSGSSTSRTIGAVGFSNLCWTGLFNTCRGLCFFFLRPDLSEATCNSSRWMRAGFSVSIGGGAAAGNSGTISACCPDASSAGCGVSPSCTSSAPITSTVAAPAATAASSACMVEASTWTSGCGSVTAGAGSSAFAAASFSASWRASCSASVLALCSSASCALFRASSSITLRLI